MLISTSPNLFHYVVFTRGTSPNIFLFYFLHALSMATYLHGVLVLFPYGVHRICKDLS